ncbi:hypothetical protein AB4865_04200 [Capnocytophaga sp. ARDL2]|uniref:hypothetical protein n=1 Tax=Capnocytophaga sp. ARDL2 TaxID=3238809 RepID=UPI0035570438
MKKLVYLFMSLFVFVGCNTSDEKTSEENFDCNFLHLSFLDEQGNDLFQTNVYKEEKLSVIVTDENWNDLYFTSGRRNGQKMENVEGYAKVHYIGNSTPKVIILMLIYEHLLENNEVTSYYKLQYDDNKFDYIKIIAEKGKRSFYIRKVFYNGVEYDIHEAENGILKIVK